MTETTSISCQILCRSLSVLLSNDSGSEGVASVRSRQGMLLLLHHVIKQVKKIQVMTQFFRRFTAGGSKLDGRNWTFWRSQSASRILRFKFEELRVHSMQLQARKSFS